MPVTAVMLSSVFAACGAGNVKPVRSLDALADEVNAVLLRVQGKYGLTVQGAAAFLANNIQESQFLQFTQERLDPRKPKPPYWPYIGRGFIGATWQNNYAAYGKWAVAQGIVSDASLFSHDPVKLADPTYAWTTGEWFFGYTDCWTYANRGDFLAVCQTVNGGPGKRGTSFVPAGMAMRRRAYDALLKFGTSLLPQLETTMGNFPVKNGVRYNGSYSQPQVTHVTIIHQFVDAVLIPRAKAAGLTPVIYEDGVHDPVDYRPHLVGDQTWHTYLEKWLGKTMAGASDNNIAGGGRTELNFLRTLTPFLKLWGIGYHFEGVGAGNQHLHIDVGTFSNDGGGWVRGSWEGKPNWAGSRVIPVTGKLDKASVISLQHYLNKRRGARLAEDGVLGPNTSKAVQSWVGTKQDGDLGPISKRAVGKKLGSNYPLGDAWVNTLLQVRLNSTNTGCPWGQLPN